MNAKNGDKHSTVYVLPIFMLSATPGGAGTQVTLCTSL